MRNGIDLTFSKEELMREIQENKEEFFNLFYSKYELLNSRREELERIPTKELRLERVREILKNGK